MPQSSLLTYREACEQVLDSLPVPIAVADFIARVLEIRPSTAKNPQTVLRSKFREYEIQALLVRLDSITLIPAQLVMQGVRFALPLSAPEIAHGVLCFYPGFQGALHFYRGMETLQLCDAEGAPLSVETVNIAMQVDDSLRGTQENTFSR